MDGRFNPRGHAAWRVGWERRAISQPGANCHKRAPRKPPPPGGGGGGGGDPGTAETPERMAGVLRHPPKMAETMRPPGKHEAQLNPMSNLDRILTDFWHKLEHILQQSDTRPKPPNSPAATRSSATEGCTGGT
ncbi:Hypothetical predicted protein [Pelobates cultripes]|uniref:Uncharacterized protein n=1 Tax=Pelobates cultripes TaxID=61616 RepID=A0AAD1S7C7_PELCU|nr:Hypothetical predicted protein [Pelobates cultripes]